MSTLLRTTESRNVQGRIGGGSSVASLTLILLGFVLATALVIALARTSTSRWERSGRAARAPRREIIAPGAALTGDAAPPPGGPVRRFVAALGRPGSLRALLKGAATDQVAARMRPLWEPFHLLRSRLRAGGAREPRPTTSRTSAAPVDDDATERPVPVARRRSRAARGGATARPAGAAGRGLFQRGARPAHRRARGLLHRLGRTEDPPVRPAGEDESLTGSGG